MAARLGQLLRAAGLALLTATAAMGVALAAAGLLASTGPGSRWVGARLAGLLDGTVAGRFTLGGLAVSPGGEIELRDLALLDPAGRPVIQVGRARLRLELAGLIRRSVGVVLELERPEVLLEPGAGGLNIAEALATPAGPAAGSPGPAGDPWRGWTVRVEGLRLRGGAVRWRGGLDRTWLEASALDLDGSGRLGSGGFAAALAAKGALEVPLQGPVELEVSARIEGHRLTVPRLALSAGGSRLEALGEWDWERGTFRAAASRLALSEADLATVAGQPVSRGDLAGRLFVGSDGERLTAAIDVTPVGSERGGGRLALAVVPVRGPSRTIGFDAAVDGLDPARLLPRAPRGRISFTGRGAVAWPIPPPGPFSRGHVAVDRLDAALPGLRLTGEGRWREAGALAGTLRLAASDLAAAGPALGALLGATLPALTGEAEASLSLAGTAASPEATLALSTPACTIAGERLEEAYAGLKLSGLSVELDASARLGFLDGTVAVARGAATLAPGWRGAQVTRLEAGLERWAWTLRQPATVAFDPPWLDRAELESGAQRLALSGGTRAGGEADARLELTGLELARLPRGLVPASLGLAGRADGTLRFAGPAGRRTLDAHASVSGGALGTLQGLALQAGLAWRRETGRATLEGSLRRAEGGGLALSADLPSPLATVPAGLPVAARLAFDGWPLEVLIRALGVQWAAEGRLEGELELSGTVAAPRLAGRASIAEGRWSGVEPLALTATLDGTGPALRATAELTQAATSLARASAELPYERGELLPSPGRTLRQLAWSRWAARLEVPGADLAAVAGKAGWPEGLTGRIAGRATLGGTPAAPRGAVDLEVRELALPGSPSLSGRTSATLEAGRTSVEARLEHEGAPAVRLQAAVAAPAELLGRREVQRVAPLEVSAEVLELALSGQAGRRWSPSGTVTAKLEARGTLSSPQGTLSLDGKGLKLGGQPLGDLTGSARVADGASRVEATLIPVDGGTLRAEGDLAAAPGVQTTGAALAAAPLRLVAKGRDLSLAFLPALLPGALRAASGRAEAELTVTGSPGRPRLAGTMSLAGGTATLPGWGTFTGIGFQASLDPKALRLEQVLVERGEGRVEGRLALEGLDAAERRLSGSLAATAFTLARAGTNVATIDARAALGGRVRAGRAELGIDVESGATIRLPRKAPRALQPLEGRPDIVIGEAPPAVGTGEGGPEGAPGAGRTRPDELAVTLRVRADGVLVKSDQPRVNVEVRTDSTWEVTSTPVKASGTLDVVLGSFEPVAGRIFKVVRGHVGFSGGEVGEGQLDLAADYDAMTTKVHATVGGTVRSAKLRLTSEPPLDEAALAMLIVTGKTELTVGGTSGAALTAQDAGMAAATAVANRIFEEQLGEKMPLDTLVLDTRAVTAGKQLTDRVFVSYVRRFDARPELGENTDEVRVQYHLTRRWTLETRYGNAGAGGASIMWQKDY